MKKFIAFVAILLATSMASATLYAQSRSEKKDKKTEKAEKKAARDAKRKRQKAIEAAKEGQAFQAGAQAIRKREFVLEADQLVFRNGQNVFVNTGTNFILVDVDKGTVQVASNSGIGGPNGIGGVTVDGTISNIEISTTKKGDIQCSFSILGAGISAQIFLTMPNGDNRAQADISPNFNSQNLTLSGKVVPLEQSSIYKGRSF